MKTKIIIVSFLACVSLGHAQFLPAFSGPSSNIHRDGWTGFGMLALPAITVNAVEIQTRPSSISSSDGLRIFSNAGAVGEAPNLFLDNQSGMGLNWRFESSDNAELLIYDAAGAANIRLHLDGNTGNFGVGNATTGAPQYKLDVEAAAAGDGIRSINFSGGDASVILENPTTGGIWSINTLGSASGPDGNFIIRDNASGANRLFIDGAAGGLGNVGIGTSNPGGRLTVEETTGSGTHAGEFSFSTGVTAGGIGIITRSQPPGVVNGQVNVGLNAEAIVNGTGTRAFGVRSRATSFSTSGSDVYGGHFEASGGSVSFNVGVFGSNLSTAAAINAGIYGLDIPNLTNTYAGYFNGNVHIAGNLTVTSDRKLKRDVRLIENAAEKISLLKPSIYKFRTDEFAGLSLPQGEQMGLIAQELEEVFPELISEVKGYTLPSSDGKPGKTIPSYKTVNYLGLIPVLIASMQEQQIKINKLESQAAANQNQQTAGVENLNNLAGLFSMETNVPNPFTHETSVGFTLPHEVQDAYLGVYDMTGKQVKTFVITERGKSHITISADNLVPGIYIYSVIADNKVVDAKRMVVEGR